MATKTIRGSGTCHADSRFTINYECTITETSTNVGNNTSAIDWHYKVYVTSSITFTGATRYHAGWFKFWVNGTQLGDDWTGLPNGMKNGTVLLDKSGTLTVAHKDDGTKECWFSAQIDSADDDTGKSGWYWNPAPWSQDSIVLTNIPRASQPSTDKKSVAAGDEITIYTNRASESFTHALSYSIGGTSGPLVTNLTVGYTWKTPLSLLTQFPNAPSGTVEITCVTYNGSKMVGSKTCTFTLTAPTDAKPSDPSVTLTETGTDGAGRSLASVHNVAGDEVVNLMSVKKLQVSAIAQYGASVTSIAVTNGDQTQTVNGASGTLTFSNLTSGTFTVTATDSRGLTNTKTISGTFVPYEVPTIQAYNALRTTQTADTGTLTASGTWWSGTIGTDANALTYSVTGSMSATGTADVSGTQWSISKALSDVNYKSSFKYSVSVTDTFGNTASTAIYLNKSVPTIWAGRDTFKVNGTLMIGDEAVNDYVVEEAHGQPTGSWNYQKFASGTCVLYGLFSVTPTSNTSIGGMGYTNTITIPTPFGVANAAISGTCTGLHTIVNPDNSYASKTISFRLLRPSAAQISAQTVKLIVYGKWR